MIARTPARPIAGAALAAVVLLAGCASPEGFQAFDDLPAAGNATDLETAGARDDLPTLGEDSTLDDYLRYAALNAPDPQPSEGGVAGVRHNRALAAQWVLDFILLAPRKRGTCRGAFSFFAPDARAR